MRGNELVRGHRFHQYDHDRTFSIAARDSRSRKEPIPHDVESYKRRNLVERAVAAQMAAVNGTPYDEPGAMFLAMVHALCIANAIT